TSIRSLRRGRCAAFPTLIGHLRKYAGCEAERQASLRRTWPLSRTARQVVAGSLNAGVDHLSGGCHLNRAIEEVIKRGGFSIEQLDKGYLRGPKIMTFMYEGRARPR